MSLTVEVPDSPPKSALSRWALVRSKALAPSSAAQVQARIANEQRLANALERAECRVYTILAILGTFGAMQLLFAFTIPYLTIGLLGLAVLSGSIALARDMMYRRHRYLLFAILQPPLTFVIVYTDYVSLAKALDQDGVLATEDDLERSVQTNVGDRDAAFAGVAIDVLVVLFSFALANYMIDLRRAYLGRESSDEPFVLLVLAAMGRAREPPNHRASLAQQQQQQQQQPQQLPLTASQSFLGAPWAESAPRSFAPSEHAPMSPRCYSPRVAPVQASARVRPPFFARLVRDTVRPPGRASRGSSSSRSTADLV